MRISPKSLREKGTWYTSKSRSPAELEHRKPGRQIGDGDEARNEGVKVRERKGGRKERGRDQPEEVLVRKEPAQMEECTVPV